MFALTCMRMWTASYVQGMASVTEGRDIWF